MPTCLNHIPVPFQATCTCFSWLCISFLFLSLRSRSLLFKPHRFPVCLAYFLNIRMEGSCSLRKVSLKSCQLLSATLSLRTVFQGILPTNSLSSWNSTLPKFRVLTLLFARPVFLKIPNSAGVWSLQPRLLQP